MALADGQPEYAFTSAMSAIDVYREELAKSLDALKKERPINCLEDVARALIKNPSQEMQEHIRHRDNGFYIKNVEYAVNNTAIEKAAQIIRDSGKGI